MARSPLSADAGAGRRRWTGWRNVGDWKGGTTHLRDTSTHFDPAGNLVSATDALGHTATFDYDADSRLTRSTDGRGNSTRDDRSARRGRPLRGAGRPADDVRCRCHSLERAAHQHPTLVLDRLIDVWQPAIVEAATDATQGLAWSVGTIARPGRVIASVLEPDAFVRAELSDVAQDLSKVALLPTDDQVQCERMPLPSTCRELCPCRSAGVGRVAGQRRA
ncbi:RHS repeat domain-containing protein [Kutzneria sp. NPDC051319]|uniref:RHS repeat domain-containing protein n=1 Tax=Kutzneria sp. NPDC051319 TaxID=3155047 RepID=UPI00343D06AD